MSAAAATTAAAAALLHGRAEAALQTIDQEGFFTLWFLVKVNNANTLSLLCFCPPGTDGS